MRTIRTCLTHNELCNLLGVATTSGLTDVEMVYNPNAHMWMLIASVFDSEKEFKKFLESDNNSDRH